MAGKEYIVTAFEIILLLCGIICVVVSFVMSDSGKKNDNDGQAYDAGLTEEQKEDIRRQVSDIIDEEMQNASEKTEVSLDKISNTKILEMNEYADNVLGEINRNHNEAVFLYDMLNDKAKEVKSTVKDVNTTKKQVEKMQAEVISASENAEEEYAGEDGRKDGMTGDDSRLQQKQEPEFRSMTPEIVREINMAGAEGSMYTDSYDSYGTDDDGIGEVMDMVSPQELMAVSQMMLEHGKQNSGMQNEEIKNSAEHGYEAAKDDVGDDAYHGANRNAEILRLHESGMDSRQIAKKLNLGIGEVKLVIDLYKSTK